MVKKTKATTDRNRKEMKYQGLDEKYE